MTFIKTPPTEPGWYYFASNKVDQFTPVEVYSDFIGSLRSRGRDTRGGEWGGRVPAPGMTFTVEETAAYLEEHLDAKLNIRNQNLEEAIRFINDELCGLAATTNRNRKEQG